MDREVRSAADEIAGMLGDDGEPQGDMHIDRRKGGKTARDRIEEGDGAADVDNVSEDDEAPEEDSDDRRRRREAESDEAEDSGDHSANDDEAEAEAINSVADIARELGLDPEELLDNLTHEFKASGKVESVTLSELVKGYQRQADYNRDKNTLAEARRALDAERRQQVEAYNRDAHLQAQQMAMARSIFEKQLQSPELLALQQTDPTSYLMKRDEIERQITGLDERRMQAAQQYDAFIAQAINDQMARERQVLEDKVDGWGEEKLGHAVEVMRGMGYKDEEISRNPDHRAIMAALELRDLREKVAAYESERKAAKKTAKRVKEDVPNAPKPGKRLRNGRLSVQRDKLSQARKRLAKSAKTGGRDNLTHAASVIEQLI